MCHRASLDLALEQLINILFVVINFLSIFQQVADRVLGTVQSNCHSESIILEGPLAYMCQRCARRPSNMRD